MISYSEPSRQTWKRNFDPIFELLSLSKNRLHSESGGQVEEPIHPDQYSRWHPFSSTSWWDKSEWNWKWAHKNFWIVQISFCYSWFRLQSMQSVCVRIDLTRDFLEHLAYVITLTSQLRFSRYAIVPSTCHPWCHIFDRALLVLVLFPFSISLTSTFISFTVNLFSVLHNFHSVITAEG